MLVYIQCDKTLIPSATAPFDIDLVCRHRPRSKAHGDDLGGVAGLQAESPVRLYDSIKMIRYNICVVCTAR